MRVLSYPDVAWGCIKFVYDCTVCGWATATPLLRANQEVCRRCYEWDWNVLMWSILRDGRTCVPPPTK